MIGAWLRAQPELRTTLTSVAARDQEPKLREQAKNALEGKGPVPPLATPG